LLAININIRAMKTCMISFMGLFSPS